MKPTIEGKSAPKDATEHAAAPAAGDVWFIKDEAIVDETHDEFAHADIARELKNKIFTLGAPLTLSLEGPHGTGKSCIGELLRQNFVTDSRYEFVRIEAWRHSGDSRRKAFLYDVLEGLKNSRKADDADAARFLGLQERLYRTTAEQHSELNLHGFRSALKTLVREARTPAVRNTAIIFGISVLGLLLWLLLTSNTRVSSALSGLLLAAPSVLSLAAVTYFGTLLSKFVEKHLEPAKITFTVAPPSSSEQFEQIFRETVSLAAGKTEKTLIVLVDELDRLPAGEILEAINVVRTFRDVKPCVVVVALDEDVIVRALRETPAKSAGLIRNDIEAEEFLNKFFKFRQHIPPVVPRDMQEFARALISKGRMTQGIGALQGAELDDVLDALLHPGVRTPRHVIRLLNAYNDAFRLAQHREQSKGLLSRGAITKNLPFLAIVTAIREDFSEFHETLSRNPLLLHVIDKGLDGQFSGSDNSDLEIDFPGYTSVCAQFFRLHPTDKQSEQGPNGTATSDEDQGRKDFGWSYPHADYRDLILHLQGTKEWRTHSVDPFIFFREDASARAIGSGEIARQISEEFTNNYVSALKSRFEEAQRKGNSTFASSAATVALDSMRLGRGRQRQHAVAATCAVFEFFPPDRRNAVSDAIAQVSDDMASIIDNVGRTIDANSFLQTLAVHGGGFYQERCIDALLTVASDIVTKLEGDDFEDDTLELAIEIWRGFALNATLLVSSKSIESFGVLAETITKKATLEDLKDALELLNSDTVAPTSIRVVFPNPAWQQVAIAYATAKQNELPSGATESIKRSLEKASESAPPDWPGELVKIAIALQTASIWGLRDLGVKILNDNVSCLDLATARKALTAVITSANGNLDKRTDVDTAYEQIAALSAKIAESFEDVAKDVALRELLDTHCAKFVALESDVLRVKAYELYSGVSPTADKKFSKTAAALVEDLVGRFPDETAREPLLVMIGNSGDFQTDQWAKTFNLGASTIAAQSDTAACDQAAEILLIGLRDTGEVQESALESILGLSEMLTPTADVTSLTDAARVLDAAAPLFKIEACQTYALALSAMGSGTTTIETWRFTLDRATSLRTNGNLADASKTKLCTSMLSRWEYLGSNANKLSAIELLNGWREQIAPEWMPQFFDITSQIALIDPTLAWTCARESWNDMSAAQREGIVDALFSTSVADEMTSDIATMDALEPQEVSKILATVVESNSCVSEDVPRLHSLAQAMISKGDAEQNNACALSLFMYVDQHESGSGAEILFQLASRLQTTHQKAGAEVLARQLRGDVSQREMARRNLKGFLGTSPSDESRELLVPVIADLIIDVKGNDLKLLVDRLHELRWNQIPEIDSAIRTAYEAAKKDRNAREDKKVLQSAIRLLKPKRRLQSAKRDATKEPTEPAS